MARVPLRLLLRWCLPVASLCLAPPAALLPPTRPHPAVARPTALASLSTGGKAFASAAGWESGASGFSRKSPNTKDWSGIKRSSTRGQASVDATGLRHYGGGLPKIFFGHGRRDATSLRAEHATKTVAIPEALGAAEALQVTSWSMMPCTTLLLVLMVAAAYRRYNSVSEAVTGMTAIELVSTAPMQAIPPSDCDSFDPIGLWQDAGLGLQASAAAPTRHREVAFLVATLVSWSRPVTDAASASEDFSLRSVGLEDFPTCLSTSTDTQDKLETSVNVSFAIYGAVAFLLLEQAVSNKGKLFDFSHLSDETERRSQLLRGAGLVGLAVLLFGQTLFTMYTEQGVDPRC